ncbi:MAG: hypothetical protein IJX61_01255, partial [Ruminococcus sp.]|nr:hypothetical protein [Ruminococcus sp.]
EKKICLLDRMLDGTVSSGDYERQSKIYDKQIVENQSRIDTQAQTKSDRQACKIDECIECVNKMLDFEESDENICGEVTECIAVYHGHTLGIKLRYVPVVMLRYRTSGRGSRYTAEFEMI